MLLLWVFLRDDVRGFVILLLEILDVDRRDVVLPVDYVEIERELPLDLPVEDQGTDVVVDFEGVVLEL